MRGQPGFFDVDDRLKRLSDLGDQLETFRSAVDFELFRPELNAALSYTDRTEGGRPPFDPVLMFKILVIQATNNLSDERAEFPINDRLSFMRFYVSIDRRFGFIRRWVATDAATYEGRRLRQGLLDKTNPASGVWADTAYRSAANETFLTKNGFVSHIHRKKPKGRVMPNTMRRANNAKSKIRARVEHVFAEQKHRMELFVRTIGIARATIKIGMANLVYNIKRLIFLRKIAIA